MCPCVEQEEVDLLEEELDSDDPVRSLQGELRGYQLLYQQYRMVFPYHGKLCFVVIPNVLCSISQFIAYPCIFF
jgi:hypothetical protein